MKQLKKRNISADIIRSVAIFLVILFHLLYAIKPDNSFRYIGFVGLSLFFIVSGFILAENYPKLESFSLKWFFKRYIKISSLYYLALIFLVLLFGQQIYHGSLIKNLFYHFLFIDFISAETAYSIISPAWFLIPLMGLYLLFPYLNRLVKRFQWILLLVFIATVLYRIKVGEFTDYSFFSPLFFIGEFCFGISFSHKKNNPFLLFSILNIFVMPVMFLPYLIFYFIISINWEFVPYKLFAFFGANTFALFLFHESFIKLILGKWHIYSLGKSSSLFLLGVIVIFCVWLSKKIQKIILKE